MTSSQTTIDAQRVSEAPVGKMLDYLSYEPGVGVNANNELSIRGGGPSEIRFQVDGVDRTDALTGNAYTQLNQTLVSEVQVLTGGFNAEYGNVRAGMVNAVLKDGTERGRGPGWSAPWFSGVGAYAPAQRKHFGPGAYDEDQYDYRMMLASNDTMQHYNSRTGVADAFKYGQVYWPLMYAQTATAAQFNNVNSVDNTGAKNYKNPRSSVNLIFEGWQETIGEDQRVERQEGRVREEGLVTPDELRQAWEWEANMNERVWQYGDEPDRNFSISTGWALPNKLGGLVGRVYLYERDDGASRVASVRARSDGRGEAQP